MASMTSEELRQIELSLAYDRAGGLIEGHCLVVEVADVFQNGWYDLATSHLDLSDEVAYLDARRLLQHHPEHPTWVIVLDEDEPLPAAEGLVN